MSDDAASWVPIREAARQLGVSDTAIRKAIKAGRCQRRDDGLVQVEAIRRGMATTANPTRGGVRHAGVLGAGAALHEVWMTPAASPSDAPSQALDVLPAKEPRRIDVESELENAAAQVRLLLARAAYESARAEREQIALAVDKREVAAIEPMVKAMTDAAVLARTMVMELPTRLGPMLAAEADPVKCFVALDDECRRVCATLADALERAAERLMKGETE